MTIKKMLLSSEEIKEAGHTLLSGSGNWVVPNGVSSISVLIIEGGATGGGGGNHTGGGSTGGTGGLGGRRRYINNVPVTPGDTIPYSITARAANFGAIITGTSGGVDAGAAGTGGVGSGATALQTTRGNGGFGGTPTSFLDAEVDYPYMVVGPYQVPAVPGSWPGGGGGGGCGGVNLQGSQNGALGAVGAAGLIYILWPGDGRSFPRARTNSEVQDAVNFDPRGTNSELSKFATDGAGTWVGIDTSNIVGRRGRIFRSTDNGRTFTYVATPRDERISGVAYDSGTWIVSVFAQVTTSPSVYAIFKSTDGGQTWASSNISLSAIGQIFEVSAKAGRFYLSGGNTSAIGDDIAYSANAGVTWTPKRTGNGDYTSPMAKHTRILFLSNSVLLTARSLAYSMYVSRDSGVTWASTAYYDAAKVGTTTLALNGSADSRVYVSTNDLVSATVVPGITLTAPAGYRLLVPLADRILIIDGPVTYQYKAGVVSVVTRLPIDLPVTPTTSNIIGKRYCTDGYDALVTFEQNDKSANFRSSVYVS